MGEPPATQGSAEESNEQLAAFLLSMAVSTPALLDAERDSLRIAANRLTRSALSEIGGIAPYPASQRCDSCPGCEYPEACINTSRTASAEGVATYFYCEIDDHEPNGTRCGEQCYPCKRFVPSSGALTFPPKATPEMVEAANRYRIGTVAPLTEEIINRALAAAPSVPPAEGVASEPEAYIVKTSYDSWLFHASEKRKADLKVKELQGYGYGTIFCTPLYPQSATEFATEREKRLIAALDKIQAMEWPGGSLSAGASKASQMWEIANQASASYYDSLRSPGSNR